MQWQILIMQVTEICELRYMLEKVNREIMKMENIALNKLYKKTIQFNDPS